MFSPTKAHIRYANHYKKIGSYWGDGVIIVGTDVIIYGEIKKRPQKSLNSFKIPRVRAEIDRRKKLREKYLMETISSKIGSESLHFFNDNFDEAENQVKTLGFGYTWCRGVEKGNITPMEPRKGQDVNAKLRYILDQIKETYLENFKAKKKKIN